MHLLPDRGHLLLALSLGAYDVHRERRGQRCQGRTTRRKRARHKSDHEQHTHDRRQIATCRNGREQRVAYLGDAFLPCEYVKEHSQAKKQEYHRNLQQTAGDEVLLRILRVAAAQRALHHVLIQTRHRYHSEHARQKLLPEIFRVVHIVEEEHL